MHTIFLMLGLAFVFVWMDFNEAYFKRETTSAHTHTFTPNDVYAKASAGKLRTRKVQKA